MKLLFLYLALQAIPGLAASDFVIDLPIQAYAPLPDLRNVSSGPLPIPKSKLSKYPKISLDYGNHVPTKEDASAGYVTYSNIRYGQNPVGDLRFTPALPPQKISYNRQTFDGSIGRSCWQANPQWATDSIRKKDADFDWEDFFRTETDGDDCLFLDVSAPVDFKVTEKLPVLVWIYGGGFAFGAKDMPTYSPAGFYRRATKKKENRFLYVAINYRMGAHGFLSGPRFHREGGTPNLGLHDQRTALTWVQTNIAKFGGDPKKVTVMGESAGAASVVHQLVWSESEKSKKKTPFQKAIISSPAWAPVADGKEGDAYQNGLYEEFLDILGADNLIDVRRRDTKEIVAASRELVRRAPHGTFNAGPVVDGKYITDHPLNLMSSGKIDKAVKIFTGVVGGEGLPFVPLKTIATSLEELKGWRDWTNKELRKYITSAMPLITDQQAKDMLKLYPIGDPIYWGNSYVGITVQTKRVADLAGEALVQCTARAIGKAYNNETYHYYFDRTDDTSPNNYLHLPLLHGGDVAYTFHDSSTSNPKLNIAIADTWQKYLMGFVLTGNPNLLSPKPNLNITTYGTDSKVLQLDFKDIAKTATDPYVGLRCDAFWPSVWKEYGKDGKEGKKPKPGKPHDGHRGGHPPYGKPLNPGRPRPRPKKPEEKQPKLPEGDGGLPMFTEGMGWADELR